MLAFHLLYENNEKNKLKFGSDVDTHK